MKIQEQLRIYYIGTIIGVIFAVAGFSYNAWRLELTEENNNIRTASFAVLGELAELEQLIYAGHYDKDSIAGSPRRGWVKVGLIVDLSGLINIPVQEKAILLKTYWMANWENYTGSRATTDNLIIKIDAVRNELKSTLATLD